MKKVILGVFLCLSLILVSGCGSNKELDLEKIETALDELKMERFDRVTASSLVNESSLLGGTEDVFDYDLEEMIGISRDDIDNGEVSAVISTEEENRAMYFILKPTSDGKDKLKEAFENYFKRILEEEKGKTTEQAKKNVTMLENKVATELDGHLVYIVAPDANAVLDVMKKGKPSVFGAMMKTQETELEALFNIKASQLDAYLIKTAMMITNSDQLFVVKPAKGEKNNVKSAIDAYMKKLEEQWSTYLPAQYELVKNRMVTTVGDYLVYIVSKDNEAVLKTIKENTK